MGSFIESSGRTPDRCGTYGARIALAGLLAVASAAVHPPVAAQELERDASAVARRVEVLSAEGVEAYKSGRYREALARFKAALALQPVANLLFNIARIHEKLDEVSEAVTYYERYERAPDAEPTARDSARERLVDLRARLAAQTAVKDPGPPPLTDDGGAGTGIGATGGPDTGGSQLGSTGWVLLGIGGATAITGGVLGGLALGAQSDFDSATAVNDKRAYRDDAKTLALASDVTIGVGVAALVAGIVLVVVDATAEPASASASGTASPFVVAPVVGADGGGIQAHLTF